MARRGCALICAETDFKKGDALIDVLLKDPDAEPDPDFEELRTRGDARCFVCGCNLQGRPTAWLIFVMNEDTSSREGVRGRRCSSRYVATRAMPISNERRLR